MLNHTQAIKKCYQQAAKKRKREYESITHLEKRFILVSDLVMVE